MTSLNYWFFDVLHSQGTNVFAIEVASVHYACVDSMSLTSLYFSLYLSRVMPRKVSYGVDYDEDYGVDYDEDYGDYEDYDLDVEDNCQ